MTETERKLSIICYDILVLKILGVKPEFFTLSEFKNHEL